MSDIWAVVPVKDFELAKQRLAVAYSPSLRRALARAMLEDVLTALRAAEHLAGVVVVTADPEAALLAGKLGARILFEHQVRGLNSAVTLAARNLAIEGRAGVLVVPGDIPALKPAEVAELVSAHGTGPAVSLIAAHDGQGTNALLATPPCGLSFHYGEGSFAKHCAAARHISIEPTICHAPGIAFDVDTPADIAVLKCLPHRSNTRALLEHEGLL